MKILLAAVGILLALVGGMLGVHIWRFCKVHTSEEILANAENIKSKLTIITGLTIIEMIVCIVLIIISNV